MSAELELIRVLYSAAKGAVEHLVDPLVDENTAMEDLKTAIKKAEKALRK